MTDDKTAKSLLDEALKARKNSYSPYSGVSVGAALLCADGTVYTGCNIENAAFSPTICAERTAFAKAVSEGKRSFAAIAVVGGRDALEERFEPCGVCRQVMREFCSDDFEIIFGDGGAFERTTLSLLLPRGFTPAHLEK